MSGKMRYVAMGLLMVGLMSCGSHHSDPETGTSNTQVEQAFLTASSSSGVPARLMMAAAYVESGLRSDRSSASYQLDGKSFSRSPARGETIFGFSASELGITATSLTNGQSITSVSDQVAAYAKFVKAKMGDDKVPPAAVTTEEKMRWIWTLAKIHRGGDNRRNLLAVFSKELMNTLNTGFSVQDGDGVVAHLDKESTPLREQDLPENYRQDLHLDMYHADIRPAQLFSLTRNTQVDQVNHPKKIEVVHCPYSLSFCIQLQSSEATDSTPLGAHYIIPNSDDAVPGVLQFAHHDEAVMLIASNGTVETVKDRIIVMLVGPSGRYTDGIRSYADPMWLSDFQLRLLGATVSEICIAISRTENVNKDQCQKIGGANGVVIRAQAGDRYRWGDISDFDETIFAPYLNGVEGISSTTALTLTPDVTQAAGTPFKLTVAFQATTRRVELERLVRCPAPDRRVVWEPVDQRQVRNVSSYGFDTAWYDAGPNGTGDQFFRVKANGDGGKFLGWSSKRVQMRGFEKTSVPEAPSKYCLRNGT